jgi:predicted nuclease with RNAse H fold
MLYMGVDLKTTTRQRSSLAVIDSNSSIVLMGSFSEDRELIEAIRERRPQLIAIGSPLTLPTGLCCLESTCACRMVYPENKGRQAELELARMGISCFFTNKKSIVTKLVYRAVTLKHRLTDMGQQIIEVYPHASKLLLFGDKLPPKRNAKESLGFLKDRLPNLVKGLDEYMLGLDSGSCESLINAHIALLHASGETDVVGSDTEGLIALPRLLRI